MYPEFLTLNDPHLQKMADEADHFVQDIINRREPRWLSFVGKSGTGKTFLSEMIFRTAYSIPELRSHASLINGVHMAFWPKLLSQLREGEYWRALDMADANFAYIDEISIEHDPSGFGKDKLCEIISRRVGKWTLLTSNLTLEKLADIDARISSRMIRGNSVVVEVDTIDYALRPESTTMHTYDCRPKTV